MTLKFTNILTISCTFLGSLIGNWIVYESLLYESWVGLILGFGVNTQSYSEENWIVFLTFYRKFFVNFISESQFWEVKNRLNDNFKNTHETVWSFNSTQFERKCKRVYNFKWASSKIWQFYLLKFIIFSNWGLRIFPFVMNNLGLHFKEKINSIEVEYDFQSAKKLRKQFKFLHFDSTHIPSCLFLGKPPLLMSFSEKFFHSSFLSLRTYFTIFNTLSEIEAKIELLKSKVHFCESAFSLFQCMGVLYKSFENEKKRNSSECYENWTWLLRAILQNCWKMDNVAIMSKILLKSIKMFLFGFKT
jgi:hypothetical protein